jgi:hypothetical protein
MSLFGIQYLSAANLESFMVLQAHLDRLHQFPSGPSAMRLDQFQHSRTGLKETDNSGTPSILYFYQRQVASFPWLYAAPTPDALANPALAGDVNIPQARKKFNCPVPKNPLGNLLLGCMWLDLVY